MANIRNPQYGVKKDQDSLTTQDPNAVLYGVTPDDKFIPIKITNDGSLALGTSISLEMSDIQIGAVEIKNSTTDDRVTVNTDGELFVQGHTYGYDGAAWQKIHTTLLSGNYALDVNVAAFAPLITANVVNLYGEATVPVATETTVVSYTVPVGKTLHIYGMIGWGDWDGEFFVKVDGAMKAGGRTSSATRTLSLDVKNAPIIALSGQVVTIRTYTDTALASKMMKANLMGGLV